MFLVIFPTNSDFFCNLFSPGRVTPGKQKTVMKQLLT